MGSERPLPLECCADGPIKVSLILNPMFRNGSERGNNGSEHAGKMDSFEGLLYTLSSITGREPPSSENWSSVLWQLVVDGYFSCNTL